MVVYANDSEASRRGSSQTSMVEEGALIRERQNILRLPDLNQMQVKCTVHESKVDSLQRGMRARVHIQDRDYQGTVNSVSNQAEPSNWFSGTVKEYGTIVSIDSDPHGLRPGMTAAVEILIAHMKDVLSVPVQAVVERGGKFYCWVDSGLGYEKRPVLLGVANNTRIEIKDGLAEGDLVLLNPRAVVEEARQDVREEEPVDVGKKFGGEKPKSMPKIDNSPAGGAPAGADGKQKGARGNVDLMSFDKDGDKKVSKDEAPEQMKSFFDRIDTNSDGFIDVKEAAEARRRAQQRAQGGAAPGGAGGGEGRGAP
jgi:HlyD family secretion protein